MREYGLGAQILTDLGLKTIRLMTNNPKKVVGLEGYGLEIVEQVPIKVKANPHNARYLKTKREKLGHLLNKSSTHNKPSRSSTANLSATAALVVIAETKCLSCRDSHHVAQSLGHGHRLAANPTPSDYGSHLF